MKKIWMLSAGFAAAAILASAVTMQASAQKIKVIYNGGELSFDVSPKIENDRVMVPMRAVFEAFGAKVKWDGETKTVTAKKKSDTIELTVDSKEMKKNDETVEADASPVIEDGRTLIPLRAVSELLELEVSWDEDTKTVEINEKEEKKDDSWKNNVQSIDLTAFTVTGDGNSAENGVITITEAGDYAVTGKCDDGQIVIDSKGKVKLRLCGMSLTNTKGAAIYVKDADKAFITLEKDTENFLSDGETYENDEEKACITAKDNLEIKGSGALTVNAVYNPGIHASDSLEIENGNIVITAKNDAIHVNDTISISGGSLDLTAYGDAIHSEEIVDITDGKINIVTKGDVPAASNEKHFGGMGTQNTEEENGVSSKGIKAGWLLEISGGTIDITSTDHAIHCTSDITVNSGDITINSDNKGISAHGDLVINGGSFNIPKASEGIESKQIMTINDGEFYIIASDDGLNAGGGDGFGGFGGMGFMPDGNMPNGEFPQMPDGEIPQMPDGEGFGRGMQRGEGSENMPQMGEMPDFEGGMGCHQRGGEQGENMPPQMRGGENMQPDMSDNGNMPPEMGQRGGMRHRGAENAQNMPERAKGNKTEKDEENNAETMPENKGRGNRGGNMQFGGPFGGSDEVSTEHHIQINGGSFYICAVNDGIDANGSITITGGKIVIEGRAFAGGGEMGLDADGKITISGGEVLAAGSKVGESGAEQNVVLINLSDAANIGSEFEIRDESGRTVAKIDSVRKSFSQILYSSDSLKEGETYGVYIDGKQKDSFTVNAGVTNVGTAQNDGFGGMGMR